MSAGDDPQFERLRWPLYWLLIAIAASTMLARIVRVRSADPKSPTPFLSANDRSRWATIRALGDDGTYVIDSIIFDEQGNRVRGWHTIDLVRHPGPNGDEHYYSSKPTLLTTLLAGPYWLIRQTTGATLDEHPFYVGRLMLLLVNLLPLVLALVLLARLIDRLAMSNFTRVFAVAAAAFGTFLTTFVVTLNNHLPAAVTLVSALALIVPMWRADKFDWSRMALSGLLMGFLAANELPALSICVLVGVGLAWRAPLATLLGYLPGALVVAAAAIGTNLLAHGDWKTPYAHRSDGPVVALLDDRLAVPLDDGQLSAHLRAAMEASGAALSDRTQIEVVRRGDRWSVLDRQTGEKFALVRTPEGTMPGGIELRRWDNWYDYPGSYWKRENLRGIDRGERSPLVYAFHVLVGHHGLFSLTPLWVLSVIGCGMWIREREDASSAGKVTPDAEGLSGLTPTARQALPTARQTSPTARQVLALTTIVITVVVVAFYLSRPQIDRNYGGGTCCLRWLMWLTPLWLLTMLPAADWLSNRTWGRVMLIALLAVSVFSAWYAADNPWSHPWIFDYWTSLGWIKY